MSRTLIRLLYTIFRKKAINRGGISASGSPRGKVFFASLPKRRKIPCFSRPKVVLLKRLAPLTRADYTREFFMERQNESYSAKNVAVDLGICLLAAACVSGSLYFFSNYNSFVPGGVTGVASLLASLLAEFFPSLGDVSTILSVLILVLNIPIFVLVAIFVSKRTGIMLSFYALFQSLLMLLLKELHTSTDLSYYAAWSSDPLYEEGNSIFFAALGVGVISGFGFSLMLRQFGASGGTFAISAVIKHFRPERNIAWLAFALDSSVTFVTLFVYNTGINSLMATLINIFLSDFISDFFLQGGRNGYKFNIITDRAEELSEELMRTLGRGVTCIHGEGMYTHSNKDMLICIIRKRQVGTMLKILKKYRASFAYTEKVSEIYGNFSEHPHYKKRVVTISPGAPQQDDGAAMSEAVPRDGQEADERNA